MAFCKQENKNIAEIVLENEKSLRSEEEIHKGLEDIWKVMLESMYEGCHTDGILPGGLKVQRRAHGMHQKLIGDRKYNNPQEWLEVIRNTEVKFKRNLKMG